MTDHSSSFPRVYADSLVFDGLNVMKLTPENVDAAIAAGVHAIHYTAVRLKHGDLPLALKDISRVHKEIEATGGRAYVAWSVEDIRRAKSEGRLAVVLGLQDSKPVAADLAYVKIFAELGIRIIQVTYNYQGVVGTGCLEQNDSGLTKFGRAFVEEMARYDVIPDISHCGPQTSRDVIDLCDRPILCTHSNPKGFCSAPRNKDDAILEKLSSKGGVVGIAAYSGMVYRGNRQRPTIADVLDAYEYAVRLLGEQYVAIGSDTCEGLFTREEWEQFAGRVTYPELTDSLGDWYDFDTWFAEGLEGLGQTPDIARGLLARGFSDAHIRPILGENLLRVMQAY